MPLDRMEHVVGQTGCQPYAEPTTATVAVRMKRLRSMSKATSAFQFNNTSFPTVDLRCPCVDNTVTPCRIDPI